MKAKIDVDFIRSYMKVKDYTETQFSDLIGVSHSMLNRVLNGKRGAGNKVIFGILANCKDIKIDQFCSYDQPLTKGNKNKKTA